ncbi:PepSY-associated TM helix domain-containing protein [Ferrimonas lipolytica]|uniref:Peptidase n=1 Tax=Ferrimonas lipolytica TaxID=2724191 RepID=A0A6H1UD86_9GAMM|nr:PepSY-associated TM helix domain-containing protein [Ferrimonas lipolytica]QIZ77067.1 peptidase [Ferrimonas lipolytica]
MAKSFYPLARTIHQYVSMAMLLLVLFFAVTGITLNHPQWFVGEPQVNEIETTLPSTLLSSTLATRPIDTSALVNHLLELHPLSGKASEQDLFTDWEDGELLEGELSQSFQGPGYHASLFIDLTTGEAQISERDAGVVAFLNDLHKGRYSGEFWSVVIDISALLMVLFSLSGAVLILPKKRIAKKFMLVSVIGGVIALLLALTTR